MNALFKSGWCAIAPLRLRLSTALQAVFAIAREVRDGGLDYRAMSLVYTSLLALVPLLAVSFSVLKAFGSETEFEPLLLEIFDPLGDQANAVAERILESVKKLKVGVLGFLGVLFLFYTSVSLLDKIEESFNHIWRTTTTRSAWRRLSDYLSFTLVGPLLVFSVFGGMTGLMERRPELPLLKGLSGVGYQLLHALLPYVFVMAAFTFVYKFIPNVRVKTGAALFGGLVAGLAWKVAGWLFAMFVAGSTQYHAVYSSFAILILFIVWLYVSWMIVLLGVQACFYYQHPRYLRFKQGHIRLSVRSFERVGLMIMWLIGCHFYLGRPAWNSETLSERLDLPGDCIDELLKVLEKSGFIMALNAGAKHFVPARDLSSIGLREIMQSLRTSGLDELMLDEAEPAGSAISQLTNRLESALNMTLGDLSLRELVERGGQQFS